MSEMKINILFIVPEGTELLPNFMTKPACLSLKVFQYQFITMFVCLFMTQSILISIYYYVCLFVFLFVRFLMCHKQNYYQLPTMKKLKTRFYDKTT